MNELFSQLFDGLVTPIFIVDAEMRVHYSNRSAQDMLSTTDTLVESNHMLLVHDPRARALLADGIAACSSRDTAATAKGLVVAMTSEGGARCCVAHIFPLAFGDSAVVALIVQKFDRDGHETPEVSELFGLTARETSVLRTIIEVGGVPATARALGLAEGTVKGYLKSIFMKTGTRRQAELVKLVMTLEYPFLRSKSTTLPA